MKIGIFAGNNVKELQDEVNDFIQDKFVSGISFNSVVIDKSEKNQVVNDRILVVYEEKNYEDNEEEIDEDDDDFYSDYYN